MGDHDHLFKRAFCVPEHAAGELRAVLPQQLCDAIDFSSVRLVPGDFIDRRLLGRFTDALFHADFRGVQGFIWLLLEHQSAPDRFMALRVLEYLTRIWSDLLRQPHEHDRKTLPPVICVVVHHGEAGWNAPRQLHELVENLSALPELKPLVPDFHIVVDDLALQPDAELQRRPLPVFPQLVLWALRDARTISRFFDHLHAWAEQLGALAEQFPEDFGTLMRYIWSVSGEHSVEEIQKKIIEVAPSTEHAMASAAEQLIQEGVRRGKAEGLAAGKAEGVLAILEARGLTCSAEQRAQILACKDAPQLDRWLRQAVTASRTHELFPH